MTSCGLKDRSCNASRMGDFPVATTSRQTLRSTQLLYLTETEGSFPRGMWSWQLMSIWGGVYLSLRYPYAFTPWCWSAWM